MTICLCPWSCRDFTIIKEKYKVQQYSFSHSQKRQQLTLITKQRFSTSYAQDPQCAMAWACWPKPPLHGLNLRKFLIKNYATLFRVGSSSGSNKTRFHRAQQESVEYKSETLRMRWKKIYIQIRLHPLLVVE